MEVFNENDANNTDVEDRTLRRVIARRCSVPQENVRLTNTGQKDVNGQMLSEIAIRVSGSKLPASQRQFALEANSLLSEANEEMSRADKPVPFPPTIVSSNQGQPPDAKLPSSPNGGASEAMK